MRYLSIAGLSAALSCLLTALMIALARKRRWVFEPRSDRWAQKPVAKFGGLPISSRCWSPLPTCIFPIDGDCRRAQCLHGWPGIDRRTSSRSQPAKFSLQPVDCRCSAWAGVVYPLFFSNAANIAFTIFWLVAITNAFNLLDNMDGLSPGVGLITALNTVLILNVSSDPLSWLAMAFAGTFRWDLWLQFLSRQDFHGRYRQPARRISVSVLLSPKCATHLQHNLDPVRAGTRLSPCPSSTWPWSA